MTRLLLPVPCGSTTVPRTFCSLFFMSMPRRICTSTVSSNFALAVALTRSIASAASLSRSSPMALALSLYFLPCFFIRSPASALSDFDAHRAGGAGDDLHRRLDVVRVEVGHLCLCDLAAFRHGDLADFLAVGLTRAFVDAGCLFDEFRCRRGLQHERERAILEDRDDGGDHLPCLARRPFVVRLAELHDVDAVLAERRAHGGRRGSLASLALQRDSRQDFLCHVIPSRLDRTRARPASRGRRSR